MWRTIAASATTGTMHRSAAAAASVVRCSRSLPLPAAGRLPAGWAPLVGARLLHTSLDRRSDQAQAAKATAVPNATTATAAPTGAPAAADATSQDANGAASPPTPPKVPRWKRWLAASLAVTGLTMILGSLMLERRKSEENSGGSAVAHFDLDAYKRGGGQWLPLPPDAPASVSAAERAAMGAELLSTQMIRFMEHATKRSEVEPALRSMKLPRSVIGLTEAETGAAHNSGGEMPPLAAVYRHLHETAALTHEHATLLLDNPRNWKARDGVRLQIGREMLNESAQWTMCAITYAMRTSPAFVPQPGGGEPDPITILRCLLDVVQRTGPLWVQLLDIHARLGDADAAEQTAESYNRLVGRLGAANAAPGSEATALFLSSSTRQLITHSMSHLHAVRGEWARCVKEHQELLRGMMGSVAPGHEQEVAAQMAALSHARLQQQKQEEQKQVELQKKKKMKKKEADKAAVAAAAAASEAIRAAVLDAQHAVALLGTQVEANTWGQVSEALDAQLPKDPKEKRKDAGASAASPPRIGDTPYTDLLSPVALDRARAKHRSILADQPRASLLQSPKAQQIVLLKRLSQVASVYQQLGLALQAAGDANQAQRAFAFADEIAAMRPKV